MLKFDTVPVTDKDQSHAIRITEQGPFFGTVFLFGPIEVIGKTDDGNLQIAFEYELLTQPKDVITKEAMDREIGAILSQILDDSQQTSEEEQLESELAQTQQQIAGSPIVEQTDGTLLEVVEVNED